MEPGLTPEAMSMALWMAHTAERLTTTLRSPKEALMTACRRLPFHASHSHFNISPAVYLLSSGVK